jgi:hypothetical protein
MILACRVSLVDQKPERGVNGLRPIRLQRQNDAVEALWCCCSAIRGCASRTRPASERRRLVDDKLFLYQQKTGTPVYCPLPSLVVERLMAVKNDNDRFFFYDGTSQPQSMVKSWHRVFQNSLPSRKAAHHGRTPASVQRHVFGLVIAKRRIHRDRVEAAGSQLDQGRGKPLLAMGQRSPRPPGD